MRLLFFPFLGFSRAGLRRRLDGKTVLITGASYGIGESLVEARGIDPEDVRRRMGGA